MLSVCNLSSWPLGSRRCRATASRNRFSWGAKERVPCRLVASRVPESVVNEIRRSAKKKAKKKGYTPSKAHLTLLAWSLFITNVPHPIWKAEAVIKVYPLRWQIELIFKSGKSYLHLASIKTKKADSTLCSLYGRMLLI